MSNIEAHFSLPDHHEVTGKLLPDLRIAFDEFCQEFVQPAIKHLFNPPVPQSRMNSARDALTFRRAVTTEIFQCFGQTVIAASQRTGHLGIQNK